jgi:gluconolactonase
MLEFGAYVWRYIRVIPAMLTAISATASMAADVAVVAKGLQFPEGVIFVGNVLYFVDYSTSDVLRLVGDKVERVWHQDGCGANGLVELHGELLVACYEKGTIVRITTDGKIQEAISHDDNGGNFISPNDLTADSAGGVYFTGSGTPEILGKVYYRDSAGRVREVANNINYANGLGVSRDGKILYVVESRSGCLLSFDIVGGGLSHRAVLVKLADILGDGRPDRFTPDGLRVDKNGNLFVGLYDGGGFAVLAADGKLIKKTELPAAHHASLAISPGGDTLFVTATDDASGGGYRGELLRVDNPVP